MFYGTSDPLFEDIAAGERRRLGLINTVTGWMGSASAQAQKISHQVTSMRDPYRWDAWEFTAKTFVPGVADLLGRSNLRPYLSSSFLASQEADDLRAFYRSLPFASRFDGLAFTTCAILPMLEAVKYDFPAIQKYKILPITRTFIGVYGLQCIFPHEFYYYLHRIVQSASYHCLKIGPMKVGSAIVVIVGAAAYAFGRGWPRPRRPRRPSDDW